MRTLARIPEPLRAYVVDQRWEAYGEADHEVWRRVVRTIRPRLERTAHPAYRDGVPRTGMSDAAIPRITAMDEALARFSWGAVPVDGFIPPRAFQAFQALRILPIACAIRSPEHVEYTPAPDILHEAAGHAPILVDSGFAAFLERIGLLGARTFSSPSDREAFDAIRALSIVKEDGRASAEAVEAAEARVLAAMVETGPPSEAARLARLYWWTVEYGLVGRVDDYRLYGAGLLSSLGESESCHDASVRKIPLGPECTEVAYDITRPQPQLFVAESFAHLHAVLDAVMADTACVRGGIESLAIAAASGEEAMIVFADGSVVVARVAPFERGASIAVPLFGNVRRGPSREGPWEHVAADAIALVGPAEAPRLVVDGRTLAGHGCRVVSCHPSTLAAAWTA